ncbi:MAG: hypothetical protein AAF146_21305 [Bacteroidota bacterium]
MNKDQLETHRFSDEDVLNDLRNQAGDGEAIKWFSPPARPVPGPSTIGGQARHFAEEAPTAFRS